MGAANPLDDAMQYEAAIAAEAAEIRDERVALTPALFRSLYPLLRRPIPAGFIKTTGVVKGKPYPSTGVSSVQVQISRMDNVLTPAWWWDEVEYHQEGRLARVRVGLYVHTSTPFYSREAWGGVNQASTTGNLYKGSYTNAAKVAFARVGPGWEVYLGATDFDPDTDEDAAAEQGRSAPSSPAGAGEKKITKTRAEGLVKAAVRAGVLDKLQRAATHVHGDDVGDCSDEGAAVKALTSLTVAQANKLKEWIEKKAAEALS